MPYEPGPEVTHRSRAHEKAQGHAVSLLPQMRQHQGKERLCLLSTLSKKP